MPMVLTLMIAAAVSAGSFDLAAAQTVVADINGHRAEAHEPLLLVDAQLTSVARDRAADLLRRHYFSHVNPDGATAIDALRSRDFHFAYAGENLAAAETVPAAEAGLWASPDHRDNMLEPHYTRVGIAVVQTPDAGRLVVQIFSD
jgi:uncharacterized protein YkwD